MSLYPNFSPEVQHKRAELMDVKQQLQRLGLPYAMLYPTCLRVTAWDQRAYFYRWECGGLA